MSYILFMIIQGCSSFVFLKILNKSTIKTIDMIHRMSKKKKQSSLCAHNDHLKTDTLFNSSCIFTAWTATKTGFSGSLWAVRHIRLVAGWLGGSNQSRSSNRIRASFRCPRRRCGADGRPNSPSGRVTSMVTRYNRSD